MHGAGNDFILVDDRSSSLPADKDWIRKICSPHTGIGAEGLILLQPAKEAAFFMRFFNPDGGEADMCGNGIRCAARLAHDLKIAGRQMKVKTRSGVLKAVIAKNGVRVSMLFHSEPRLNFVVRAAGQKLLCNLINTGVPHAVIEAGDLEKVDLARLGPILRRHKEFGKKGANVDFLSVTDDHELKVRTYERGVEAETLACGTGITACAIVAALNGRVRPPVKVKCRHGDILEVDFKIGKRKVENITLLGPAEYVFEGTINYP